MATANPDEGDSNYRQLKCNVKAKEEIYESLLKEVEQNKIRQQIKSMDLQVVMPADLPSTSMNGKTKLYMVVGFWMGCFLSLMYGLKKNLYWVE